MSTIGKTIKIVGDVVGALRRQLVLHLPEGALRFGARQLELRKLLLSLLNGVEGDLCVDERATCSGV